MDNSYTKLERNLRIPEDLLKAKWSQEIKKEEFIENYISKSLEWQIKSRKYYKKKVHYVTRNVSKVVLLKKRQQLGRV